jgi:hypothetical protein
MAFAIEPIEVIKVKDKVIDPRDKKTIEKDSNYYAWWHSQSDEQLLVQLLSTTAFLKKFHSARIRQASLYSRLFSGKPLYNYLASTSTLDNSQQMPMGRPTANVVYSCVDTITSQITQDNPSPVWIPDASKYKERQIAEQVNNFIGGEFYRCKTYGKGVQAFRDSGILGNGLVKVGEKDGKVFHERTLETELLVDFNDAYYGNPRGLIQTKLCDRGVLAEEMPKASDKIMMSQAGTVDSSPQSTDTIADNIIVSEGWHLPSGDAAKDGRHVIACADGILLDESWEFDYFPFSKLSYNDNMVGWFSQGLAEILFPTQMEIYKMLIIASQSIELTGVPKIIISELSKVLETAFNNNIASIIKVKTMAEAPQFVNATSNNAEIYEYIKWLIENAYQISGISSLSANGTKPAGLNSGEAQREYMNIQSTRSSAMQKRYQDFYTDLASKTLDRAALIAKRDGKYMTVYPGRDGTRKVDFPKIDLLENTNVIRCYEESSLPKDPVGRQSKLSEMLAAGEITNQEFRRLSRLPDLEQDDQLAVALEERILHDLDSIIEDGRKGYNPPDQFILDPTDLATQKTVQYYNKYVVTDIEDEKLQLIQEYFTAIQNLKAEAAPPPVQGPAQQPQQPLPVAPPQPSVSPTSNVAV